MDAPTLTIREKTLGRNPCLAQDSRRPRRAHLVGVAGSGMRALADVLKGWGWQLSGSDLNLDGVCDSAAERVRLFRGHSAEYLLSETELVVFSDAVPAENPELRRAKELGIPAISYFQMLGRVSADAHIVAVAGTHGKSTTTAMAAHVLVEAGLDPTVFCGATPLGASSGGRAGGLPSSRHTPCAVRLTGDPYRKHCGRHTECACYDGLMLIEACEYRANFLHLRPRHAAILGIEPDHFDFYHSLGQLEQAFRQFAELVPEDGFLLVRHDCASTYRATAGLPCRVESFGLCEDADWSGRVLTENQGRFSFEIRRFGRPLCEVRLKVPGGHNVLNALAAAALCWENGAAAEQIAAGLEGFAGLHRRLELLGTWRGVTLVDDYAHHPTEVTAALAAVRGMFPFSRVWCIFQPHQVSRTKRLLDELATSLQNVDRLLVAEIFRAREGGPRPGEVTAADLARRAKLLGVEVLPGHTNDEIDRILEAHLAPGDVLVTLGAGDVFKRLPGRTNTANVSTRRVTDESCDRF